MGKMRAVVGASAIVALAAIVACTVTSTDPSGGGCVEPAGTRSVVVEACYPGACSRNNELDLETGILGDSCKSGITDLSYLSQNLTVDGCNRDKAAIVDLGQTCLSDVRDPGSGYGKNVAAVERHRYFVRSLEGNSFAVAVEGYTQTIGGGIAGVRLRYTRIGGGGETDGGATSATETVGGTPICPLGWTQGLKAEASGSTITVSGSCASSDQFSLEYSPTPAPGGTAPAVACSMNGGNAGVSCGKFNTGTPATGSVSLTGTSPDLRVSGSCECAPDAGTTGKVTFDLPLTVK